jgi:hypothetical protein
VTSLGLACKIRQGGSACWACCSSLLMPSLLYCSASAASRGAAAARQRVDVTKVPDARKTVV